MSECAACGQQFSCAMVDATDGAPCWCTNLAPLPEAAIDEMAGTTGARCLCPACLAAAVNQAVGTAPTS